MRLFEAAGLEMQFSFDEAYSRIPDVDGCMPELVAEARRLAGPMHRATNDVKYLLTLYELAVAKARLRG